MVRAARRPVAGLVTAVFYGGWGKIAAAASAQYVIDRFAPQLLVNLGTCGGFAGEVERGEVLLADETLVYDIVEQMTDADEAIAERATTIDLSWLDGPDGSPPAAYPSPVRRVRLLSADSDIVPAQVGRLRAEVRRRRRRLGVGRDRLDGRPQRRALPDPAGGQRPRRLRSAVRSTTTTPSSSGAASRS